MTSAAPILHDSASPARVNSARLRHLVWAGGLLGVLPVAYLAAPLIRLDAIPICPFRCATGRPCPFCGLTRAVAAATHLQWQDAFGFNALWPAAVAVVLGLSLLHAWDAAAGGDRVRRSLQLARRHWHWIAAALVAFDVWRIAFFSG